MEYTIQKLAELAGVSTRTLRWYDELGLLPPLRVGENGYRIYGPDQVDRLQQILFYRALGVELRQIKDILDDPSFDRLTALRSHLRALEEKERELDTIIKSVRETIRAAERNEIMSDEAKFQAFKGKLVEENETRYGKEAREKYGDNQVDRANAAVMGLSQGQYADWEALTAAIQTRLEEAVAQGLSPEGEAGKELYELHRRWITVTIKDYTPAKHRGIAQLYVLDKRFQAYYDENIPGCARFLTDAVTHWAVD